MTKLIVVLVYLAQPSSAWKVGDRIEYVMPSMEVCQGAVKNAKVVSLGKGSVAVFCAYK